MGSTRPATDRTTPSDIDRQRMRHGHARVTHEPGEPGRDPARADVLRVPDRVRRGTATRGPCGGPRPPRRS